MLIDDYVKWLGENTVAEQMPGGWIEVATPFMDRHNDDLVVYVKQDGDRVIISDDGFIIGDMELSGVSSKKRMQAIGQLMRGYGVGIVGGRELRIVATPQDYPAKQHMLLHAMMAASQLFTPYPQGAQNGLFTDRVGQFLGEHGICCAAGRSYTGKSGISHGVDFVVSRGESSPSWLVYALDNPTERNAQLKLFEWMDIKRAMPGCDGMLAMLNDARQIPAGLCDAFLAYSATPALWSRRDDCLERLRGA